MKYVSLEGLTRYDTKIKNFINNHVAISARGIVDKLDNTKIIGIATCTQEEYDALNGNWERNVLYVISDDSTLDDLMTAISLKADKSDTYRKSETYSQTQANTLLDNKQDKANMVTQFQQEPDNTHYISEKLAKDSLDLKADKSDTYTIAQTNAKVQEIIDYGYEMPKADMEEIFDDVYSSDPIMALLDTINGEVI